MNQLLTQTEQKVYESLNPPQLKTAVDKVVAAGKKVMYSEQSRDLLIEQLAAEGDQTEVVGSGIAKLAGILFNQSKNTIPMQVLMPAATLLLLEGLDFMERAGRMEITPDSVAECMQAMASNVLQLFGVTPEKLQEYFSAAEQGGQAPAVPTVPANQPAPGGIVSAARGGV